ncbi:hypothetical protein Ahy_B03g065945 [Arachis hypogaea]|uniref:Aminotransferase-like plant mobile domain-containing protein n=1 Tax=Arachis hypogaea TaxID=3818 RepID=A0A445A2R3_ARAHY|nr:hypothetical protein Ahy_B03g065945 [Arachis hypogaea]
MAGSYSHAATQDKGKGPTIAPPSPPALCILNQVNDEVIDDPHLQINDTRILIPFTIGADTHCFLGPIESLERANKKLSFFPSIEGEDLLINQAFNISHFIKKNPSEITRKSTLDGIQELLRLSHFSLTTYPWKIGAVTCFWNRTTNNFHLSYGMIGMSLLDVAAITGLPINFPDCTPDMKSKHQISHAISVQTFHDQEEAKFEAELAQINEKLAKVCQNRATIAKPLVAAQQEQQHLIQELVSIDTRREEYQKQLEKVQVDKFKQIEVLSILDNKRAKLRSDLAKLVAP